MFKIIEEMFESTMLDDFYEVRSRRISSVILKENHFDNSKIEHDLLDIIEQLVQNDEDKKQILERLDVFEESMNEETSILTKNFYKVGFVDGMLFLRDIKEILEK